MRLRPPLTEPPLDYACVVIKRLQMRLKRTKYTSFVSLTLSVPHFFLIVAEMSLPKRSTPCWSNPPFQFFDVRALALSPERPGARVPECQKRKKGGLDQYAPEHFYNNINNNHIYIAPLRGGFSGATI